MNLEITDKPLSLNLHGFSDTAVNQDYSGTAFRLMDKMWKIVKSNNLKNKGLNVWVYEPNERVFAGVELEGVPPKDTTLEQKSVTLKRYAYYKHVGSYSLIKQAGLAMRDELKRRGLRIADPYIEIYGHWNNDESKLETELLMNLETLPY